MMCAFHNNKVLTNSINLPPIIRICCEILIYIVSNEEKLNGTTSVRNLVWLFHSGIGDSRLLNEKIENAQNVRRHALLSQMK